MAVDKYCGQDLYFGIKHRISDNSYENLESDYLDLVAFVYTEAGNIKKFSKLARPGYKQMKKDSSTMYHFWLESADTKTMRPGVVNLEIWGAKSLADLADGKYDNIYIAQTYNLKAAQISIEAGL